MTDLRIVAAMSRPDFYPHRPSSVEVVQTHISYVFIAGELVYKVKKAVDFGFLDFTTLEKRRENCLKEVNLNRRLAPDTYLGVAEIGEGENGEIVLGAGRTVEYAVKMKKLPMDRMLVELLAKGLIKPPDMRRVADRLVSFHGRAESRPEIDRFGSLEVIRRNHDENFEQTKGFIGRTISREQYEFIKSYVDEFLSGRRDLLQKRVSGRHIRDCHGDLHAEHICFTDGIVIFDCIEFNDRFRYSDTIADVAFLAMDLDFRGYPSHARAFFDAYTRLSGDHDDSELLPLYMCYYAYVRGKVIGFRLDDPAISAPEKEAARSTAARYFDLAAKYAASPQKPLLIITTGLMGSGKSVLAANLSALLGAEVIRTDVLRKQILNIRPEERRLEKFGKGIYSDDVTARTYEKAFELAQEVIAGGRTAIIDASFKKNLDRLRAARIAQAAGSGFFVVECICAAETVRKRLDGRLRANRDASDGRWELYQQQKEDFDPVSGMPPQSHITVDTCGSQVSSLYEAISRIRFRKST